MTGKPFGARECVLVLLALAGLLAAGPAFGQVGRDTTCRAEASPLNFVDATTGTQDVLTSGNVNVFCETGAIQLLTTVSVRMCLSIGDGSGGPDASPYRRMLNAQGDALRFQIYQDPARTTAWGSLSNPDWGEPVRADLRYQIIFGSGASAMLPVPMYGRIPAQPGLAAGNYENSFAGGHTALDYQYNQQLRILLPPSFPDSCTGGGDGGGRFIQFPFTASATVPARCEIDSVDDLDFGSIPGLIDRPRDQTSSLSFTCTSRTPWHVGLDDGQNSSGGSRRMQLVGDGGYVDYELYRDPARTQRWGTAVDVDTLPGTGTGNPQTVTVYGRVPAGQAVPAGDYRDTITVTVTY